MMRKIEEKTLISYFIESLKNVEMIDNIILATTKNKEDDFLCSVAKEMNIKFYRGSQENVLDRIYKAILFVAPNTEIVVRACADNPLVDSKIVNNIIEETIKINQLVTPFELNSIPFGIGLAVLPKFQLNQIIKITKNPIYLEHVENYLIENRKFSFFHLVNDYLSHYFYLTVDFEEDLQRCNYFLYLNKVTNSYVYKNVKKYIKEDFYFFTFEKNWSLFNKYFKQLNIKLFIFKNIEEFKVNNVVNEPNTVFTDDLEIFKVIKNVGKKYYCDFKNLASSSELNISKGFKLNEIIYDKNSNIVYQKKHILKNLSELIYILRFLRFGFIRNNLFCDYYSSSSKTDSGKTYGFEDFKNVCCPKRILFDKKQLQNKKINSTNNLVTILSEIITELHNKKVSRHKFLYKDIIFSCLKKDEKDPLNECKIDFFRDLIVDDNLQKDLIYIMKSIKYNKKAWLMIWLCFVWQSKEMYHLRLNN